MSTAIRDAVFRLLESHGVLAEFQQILRKTHVVKPKSSRSDANKDRKHIDHEEDIQADIWSIEIYAKEGISSFSKPLIVATELTDSGVRVVRLAHSWADVWDITYDPLYEYVLDQPALNAVWRPVNVYSSMQGGFKVFESKTEVDAAVAYSNEWAETLRVRGYDDTRQAAVRYLTRGPPV